MSDGRGDIALKVALRNLIEARTAKQRGGTNLKLAKETP